MGVTMPGVSVLAPGIASPPPSLPTGRRGLHAPFRFRARSIMPGFGRTFGFTVFYLSLVVLIPLAALFVRSAELGPAQFMTVAFSARAVAAYKLTFGTALIAAFLNMVFGLLVAWVLVRYRFPGKPIIDALVDLPFALPTAVAGIALAQLYAPNGWIGSLLADIGVKAAFNPTGIVIALVFIGLPFSVRTVEPVLADLPREVEEAAASLGATRMQTFARVIFPSLMPALLTGFALALARGIGEYGSVIFIAGNVPFVSEIAPLLIVTQLEQYDYPGATAIALVMLLLSFVLLFAINALQHWSRARMGG